MTKLIDSEIRALKYEKEVLPYTDTVQSHSASV